MIPLAIALALAQPLAPTLLTVVNATLSGPEQVEVAVALNGGIVTAAEQGVPFRIDVDVVYRSGGSLVSVSFQRPVGEWDATDVPGADDLLITVFQLSPPADASSTLRICALLVHETESGDHPIGEPDCFEP